MQPGRSADSSRVDPPSSASHGLCATHHLRLAPDGSCVLCRRERVDVAGGSGARFVWLAGLGVAALGLVVGAWMLRPRTVGTLASAEPVRLTEVVEPLPHRAVAMVRQAHADVPLPNPMALPSATEPGTRGSSASARDANSAIGSPRSDDPRAALAQVSVTLYSTVWCGYCKKARAFLQRNSIPFVEHDIETDETARQRARSLNPRGGVPVLQIDDRVLVGYSADSIGQTLSDALRRRSGRYVEVSFVE